MAHIAMFGVNAVSHTLPSLDILRELVDRGHRVSVVNDPDLRELVEPTGATLVPATSTLPTAEWPADPIGAMTIFLRDAGHVLDQVREHFEADPADAYLADIGGYGGRVMAETQGKPFIQLSPTFVAWDGFEDEVGNQIMALPGADEYRAEFDAWLEGVGASTRNGNDFSGRPPRAIAMIPRAMQPHADRVDDSVVTFVGSCHGDRSDQGQWNRPGDAERVVLVSLGSSYTNHPAFYRECIAAFGRREGWHLVLQIGKHVDESDLGEIPDTVEVHRWVPQLAILREADLFVTHAGMGGSGEGLATGTPMICVPQDVDQFTNADTLVTLGVARRLDTVEANAATLTVEADALLDDPEVARRSAELQRQAAMEGGTTHAADIIEAELNARLSR